MSHNLPWTKFWWKDWASDAALNACSLAARGLWIELLCRMAESEEHGFLMIAGRSPTAIEIGKMVGADRRTVERLLTELETMNVFSRDARGMIFSRRMQRDGCVSQRNAANGKRGGNPILTANKDLEEKPVKPPLKAEAEAEAEAEEEEEKEPLQGSKKTASPDPKGTRLADDWTPGEAGWDFAEGLGLDPEKTLAQFRDYWIALPAAKSRKTNWLATWRNWCRNEGKRRPNGHAKPPPPVDPNFPGWNVY
jgi:hypothetical protein